VERARGDRPPHTEALQAVGQLAGRLAGEGHGQPVAGIDDTLGGQPGDPPGEDAGLPGTGPGQDGQRRGQGGDGLPLAIVQIDEERVGIARRHGSDGTGQV
jgi:hypothetical protein